TSPTASVNSFASVDAMVLPGRNSDEDSLCALPMTKVTAMVSPSARPRPSMTPPTTPTLVYGSTTFHTTSHVVDPSAYADSFSTEGTTSNTSRITEAMNGITMIARMIPAESTPIPIGGPRNSAPASGISPSVAVSAGCT